MSSGAGAGNAVLGWVSTAGSSTSMTSRSHPSSRVGQPGGGDRGDRRGIGEHEPDPGRRQRRVDRQISRPGLEHRQHRHDRLSRPGKQQRHTRPGPTPWPANRCANRFAASSSSRYVIERPSKLSATASGVRATCAANNTGIDTGGWCGLGQHRPVTPPIQPGVLTLIEHIHRRQPPRRVGGHRHQHPLQPLR